MKLLLIREFDSGTDTIGKLYWKDRRGEVKYVYTMEDEYRTVKVPGDTRVPDGFYDIGFRKEGRIYNNYSKSSIERIRYFTQTYGVPHVLNVKGFKYILIHIGNWADPDSEGCILVGMEANNSSIERGFIKESTIAFCYLLEALEQALKKNEKIILEIRDFDREIERCL